MEQDAVKRHSNRFKKMRAIAKRVTRQGRADGAPVRGLVGFWWKLKHGHDFSMRERFTPPTETQGIFARMAAYWRGDKSQGWPDPKEFRVWVIAKNTPDTFRWMYRRLKKLRRAYKAYTTQWT